MKEASYISPFDDYPNVFAYAAENQLVELLTENPRPGAQQQIEVARVMNVNQDPVSHEVLPPDQIPHNVLASRRGRDVWGDSCAFKPTDRELLARIEQFLKDITTLLQLHLAPQQYLVQTLEASHFAFAGVTPPCTQKDFLSARAKQSSQDFLSSKAKHCSQLRPWQRLVHHLQTFLYEAHPSLCFKEIKMNADGHIVLRMTVEQTIPFMALKNTVGELFSDNYQRYSDPEKITTLACVLAVADLTSLTPEVNRIAVARINDLFTEFRRAMVRKPSVPFDKIEWVEWANRLFHATDLVGRLSLSRQITRLSTYMLPDHTVLAPTERLQQLLKSLDIGGAVTKAASIVLEVHQKDIKKF